MDNDLEKDEFNTTILALEQEFMLSEWRFLDDLLDSTEYYFDNISNKKGTIEGKSV